MKMSKSAACLAALVVILAARSLSAQETIEARESAAQRPTVKVTTPYNRVITSEAKTKTGLFIVHQIKDKIYFEIPITELDKDLLWVSRVARMDSLGIRGAEPLNTRVVRWMQRSGRILLCSASYDIVSDRNPILPIARIVEAGNNDTVLMAFDIETYGKDLAPVIEVTKLFTTEVPEFSARKTLGAQGFDASRSFLERITALPQNIEVEAAQTYTRSVESANSSPNLPGTSATILMRYSLLDLPENAMKPRLYDERVSYFASPLSQYDYGLDGYRPVPRKFIWRRRLEKKDPSATLSEPLKPIVYFIDPSIPEKWRPWVRRAIEGWQPAFEMAGYKNAIIARDVPPVQEDPNWNLEDVRYSVVRWNPSTVREVVIPTVRDPRSGEILKGDVYIYPAIMNYMRDLYFVQAAPLDPRAQEFPFPDELMGSLVELYVAHELGHELGLGHNITSGATYPADKLHDPEWLHQMGYLASIMDFPIFNYVAQPEDHVPLEDLVQRLGPYDKWAIMWGYKPIPSADSPDAEKPTLDEWARQQDEIPWLRSGGSDAASIGSGDELYAVGGTDAIYSTDQGLKNLQRVMKLLLPATSRPGESYDDLKEIYERILGWWTIEMGHVAAVIGGIEFQTKHAGQSGVVFTPVSRDRQEAAVRFLNEHAFHTPTFLVPPEVLDRIAPSGAVEYMRTIQASVLDKALDNARLVRLLDQCALHSAKAYSPVEFLRDLRQGIWTELNEKSVKIDPYRSQLQRSYIQLLAQRINTAETLHLDRAPTGGVKLGTTPSVDTVRSYLQADLKALKKSIDRALPNAADADTHAHLDSLRNEIDRALDLKPSSPSATGIGRQ